MSIETQNVRSATCGTGLGTLMTYLDRWGAPVPAEYASLMPRFFASRRESLIQLLKPTYLAASIFFLVFITTDVFLYTAATMQLLALRAALVGIYLISWLWLRRARPPWRIYRFLAVSTICVGVTICLMLAVIGQPTEFYVLPLFSMIPLYAMFPMPRFWYLASTGLIVLIYAAMMAATGMIMERSAIEMVGGMVGAIVISGVIHAYNDYQRWVSFLNHTRIEELGARLQGELALARRIQHGLLQPGVPGWPGVDLVCWSEAAREVGGDFYAYQRDEEGRVGLAVGDVSGKGLPAALLMGTSLAYLRAAVVEAASPSDLLNQLDQALVETTKVTRQNCALCCLELDGNALRVANAGGITPLLRYADGRVTWIEAGGLPLGTGLGGLGYRDVRAEVGAGDLLVLVSDGVVEAMDEAGGMFGFERLEAAVSACDGSSAFVFVAELRDTLAGFMGMAEAHDDMTIVALRVG